MRVRASVKRRTSDCQVVRRKGRVYIINKKNPRLEAASGLRSVVPFIPYFFLSTMPRLLGIDIPGDKRIEAALPYIYGIGPTRAKYILLEVAEISPDVRAKTLTDAAAQSHYPRSSRKTSTSSKATCAGNFSRT